MFAMFHLGRPDVFPLGDLAVRKGLQELYKLKVKLTAFNIIVCDQVETTRDNLFSSQVKHQHRSGLQSGPQVAAAAACHGCLCLSEQ